MGRTGAFSVKALFHFRSETAHSRQFPGADKAEPAQASQASILSGNSKLGGCIWIGFKGWLKYSNGGLEG